MADFPLPTCERTESFSAVASRGAANAKGSYVQLTASTNFPYTSVTLQGSPTGGGGQTYLIDVAVGGAGSEQVIVPNVLLDSARGANMNGICIELPIAVPAGSRLAARVQEVSGAGTRTVDVTVIGRNGGSGARPAGLGTVVNYGADTSTTNGVLVDPGAVANTYGAWTQITASTSRDHNALIAILGTNKQGGTLVDSVYFFQIGIGDAGSETMLTEFMSNMSSSVSRLMINSLMVEYQVPTGSRLSMRSKCVSSATANARHTTAILLGC